MTDSERLSFAAAINQKMRVMSEGFEQVVSDAVAKLSNYDIDLVIAIPLKTNLNLDTVFANLASIDLPAKTGVIFGLDKHNDDAWLKLLHEHIEKVANRFVFIEPVLTTAIPQHMIGMAMLQVEQDYFVMIAENYNRTISARLNAIGMKDLPKHSAIFKIIREEMRLIIKGLKCKHVLWLDADCLAPKDVISRLMRHGADMISGWAIDRHYPYGQPSLYTVKKYQPETQEETQYYATAYRFLERMNMVERMTMLRSLGGVMWSEIPNVIAPSRLKRETQPIEIAITGFVCVLTTKEVNDNSSFIPDMGIAGAEDTTFSENTRQLGYRLFVDPTCYLDHIIEGETYG